MKATLIAASDTSPLLHLARMDQLTRLQALAEPVHLLRTVSTELLHGRSPASASLRAVRWLRVDADAKARRRFLHLLDVMRPGSAVAITTAELCGA